jgi:hypothetical protein
VGEVAPPERTVTLIRESTDRRVRAQVLSRMPAERAAAATRTLDDLVARGITSPVTTRDLGGARIIEVGGVGVFGILPADLDVPTGETLEAASGLPRRVCRSRSRKRRNWVPRPRAERNPAGSP